MTSLEFFVTGVPGPQGSKTSVGYGRFKEASKKVGPWREAVIAAARAAVGPDFAIFTGAVQITITFYFARPKSHYRTGKNSHLLRDDAPYYVTSHHLGDVDKLQRATLDALTFDPKTRTGIWVDDSLVARVRDVVKVYTERTPGAFIRVSDLAAPALRKDAA